MRALPVLRAKPFCYPAVRRPVLHPPRAAGEASITGSRVGDPYPASGVSGVHSPPVFLVEDFIRKPARASRTARLLRSPRTLRQQLVDPQPPASRSISAVMPPLFTKSAARLEDVQLGLPLRLAVGREQVDRLGDETSVIGGHGEEERRCRVRDRLDLAYPVAALSGTLLMLCSQAEQPSPAVAWISIRQRRGVQPRISPRASSSRRHARRLSAWLGRRDTLSHGEAERSTNPWSSRHHAHASVIVYVHRQAWNAPTLAHTNRTCC